MALVLFLLIAGVAGLLYSLTTDKVQMWIMKQGMEMLREKLHTRVEADSIGVEVKSGRVFLYGFEMDDRASVTMLEVDTLEARMEILELLQRRLVIDRVYMKGVKANLYKERPDSAANYQFVVDAFKKEKKEKKDKKDTKGEKNGKFDVRLDAAKFERLELKWNKDDFYLSALSYDGKHNDVSVRELKVKTDNGKPRKNKGKPHRGAFDAGHLNAVVDFDITIEKAAKDSVSLVVHHLNADDKDSGLHIRGMTTKMRMEGKNISLYDLQIDFGKVSWLRFDSIHASYSVTPLSTDAQKKKKVAFNVKPAKLHAYVDLRDIAKPFAPVLSHFSTPLNLSTVVGGTQERIYFKAITVSNNDSRLRLKAQGDLCKVLEKHNLSLHFYKISLDARHGIKEQIVNHFAKKVRLKMTRQMKAVGDVRFDGSLGVFYKKERVAGKLSTDFGNVDVNFTIDGRTKYMTGTMSTDSLEIGTVMNVKGLGPVKARANYSFDTASKKRLDKQGGHHGRLPIGWLKADVDNARFKMIRFKHISAEMTSDGTTAKGLVYVPQKLFDIVTMFFYTQTDHVQTVKVKPSLIRHHKDGISLEERERKLADKQARKEKKLADKQARKEQKEIQKAEKRALKMKREQEKVDSDTN